MLTGDQPDGSSRRAKLLHRRLTAPETPTTPREPVKAPAAPHPLWDKWIDSVES
jgi:hypothetical protein